MIYSGQIRWTMIPYDTMWYNMTCGNKILSDTRSANLDFILQRDLLFNPDDTRESCPKQPDGT